MLGQMGVDDVEDEVRVMKTGSLNDGQTRGKVVSIAGGFHHVVVTTQV